MRVDLSGADELLEQQHVDAVLPDPTYLNVTDLARVNPVCSPRFPPPSAPMNEPRMFKPMLTLTVLLSVPSMSTPGTSSRCTGGGGTDPADDQIGHAAESGEVLAVTVQELERLGARPGHPEHAVTKAFEKRYRLVRSRHVVPSRSASGTGAAFHRGHPPRLAYINAAGLENEQKSFGAEYADGFRLLDKGERQGRPA